MDRRQFLRTVGLAAAAGVLAASGLPAGGRLVKRLAVTRRYVVESGNYGEVVLVFQEELGLVEYQVLRAEVRGLRDALHGPGG